MSVCTERLVVDAEEKVRLVKLPLVAKILDEVELVITEEDAKSDPVKMLFHLNALDPRSEVKLATGR